jgi:hypothetical protein
MNEQSTKLYHPPADSCVSVSVLTKQLRPTIKLHKKCEFTPDRIEHGVLGGNKAGNPDNYSVTVYRELSGFPK